MTSPEKDAESPLPAHFLDAMQTVFDPFLPMFLNITKTIEGKQTNALTEPRTYLRDLERRLENSAKDISFVGIDQEKYKRALEILFKDGILLLPDLMQRTARSASKVFLADFSHLPAYQSLDALAKDAEHASPDEYNGTLGEIDQKAIARNVQLSVSLLHHVETCTGELRAEYVIHGIKRISETLYQPYARKLHRLFRAAESIDAAKATKKKKKANIAQMEYGAIFNELLSSSFMLNYPGLLDVDVVLIRNAEAHEHWDYFSDTDEIEVSDRVGASKRFRVEDLLQRAREMLIVSGRLLPGYVNYRKMEQLIAMSAKVQDDWPELLSPNPLVHAAAVDRLQKKTNNV